MTNIIELEARRRSADATIFCLGGALVAAFALTVPLHAQETPATPVSTAIPVSNSTVYRPNVAYTPGEKGKVVGTIVARNGDDMLVREQNSDRISLVTLTNDTRVESPSGVLNLARKNQDMTLLVPGLFLKVRGSGGSAGNLVADRISFHKTALKVTNQMSAGDVEMRAAQAQTNARVTSNADSIQAAIGRARDSLTAFDTRIQNLDTYDVKFTGTVNFAVGSAKLSAEAKRTLDSLVAQGTGLKGYLVEVAGYADITGTQPENQALSGQRADAVVQYLAEVGNVPLRRIVNPTGLGTSNPAAPNSTAAGRAMNRRAEVKVLVNKGLELSKP
jgi:OmpA-OmpF porin, OOP family